MRFEDFDLGTFLVSEIAPERLEPKVDEILSVLRANPPLHEALSAYFAHDLDIAATAAALHMHRNSLRYRLARAEQLLGRSLKQPSTIAAVYLALVAEAGGPKPGREFGLSTVARALRRAIGSPSGWRSPSSPRRRTSTPSSATRSGVRPATTCPATRAAPAPTRACGRRSALDGLAADVPQDIHGIDLGPSPTPYERAELLAAEAFGAARTFFLTNGATQGNHTLCLALAPLGTRIVAQRNSHASIVDGLVLSGGMPSFVAPEYDEELGITHCVTPAALEAALRRRARRAGRVHRLADLLRHGRRRRRLRGGRARGRRAARRRPVVGPALRLQRRAAADRAVAGRRRDAHEHAQDRGLADPERDAARRPQRPRRRGRGGARAAAAALDQPVVAAARVARRRAPPARAARRAAAARDARGDRGRAREARDDPRHRAGRLGARRPDGRGRLRPAADRARRARHRPHRLRDRRRAAPLLRRPRRAADAGDGRVRRRARRHGGRRCGAWRATSTRSSSGCPSPARPRRSSRPPRRWATRWRCRRARRSSARPSRCAVDAAAGRISCESIASYPPGVPALLPGERISAETVAYLRELAASGARLHGASDPEFQTINVLAGAGCRSERGRMPRR